MQLYSPAHNLNFNKTDIIMKVTIETLCLHANNPIVHGGCNDTSVEGLNSLNAWNGTLSFLPLELEQTVNYNK